MHERRAPPSPPEFSSTQLSGTTYLRAPALAVLLAVVWRSGEAATPAGWLEREAEMYPVMYHGTCAVPSVPPPSSYALYARRSRAHRLLWSLITMTTRVPVKI